MVIMAATIVGLTSITFGGSAETVAVFTSFSQTSDSDKTIVVDEDGDHVAVAYHGKKSVANMSGYLKSTTPLIGASITLANATAGLGGGWCAGERRRWRRCRCGSRGCGCSLRVLRQAGS